MAFRFHRTQAEQGFLRLSWSVLLAALVLASLLQRDDAKAQARPPASTGGIVSSSTSMMDTLVGPIALYPDDLIAIILPASTNPLQLVQADRFLTKRIDAPGTPVDEQWDDAVKSLLNYPSIVQMMSHELDWTSELGEAVITNEAGVLDGIQSFRRRARAAGNLNTDGKQIVQVEQEVVTITPADPQVIYVPQYEPSTIVVAGAPPVYGYYPTPYPSYYYPYAPGAALAMGVVWGAAIGAAWNGGHYSTHYGGDANINVNRNSNVNLNRGHTTAQRSSGANNAWKSNKQPGQVSSSIGKRSPAVRVGDARPSDARPGGAVNGNGNGSRNRPISNNNAFSDYGSGRQTQINSSRGAASRGTVARSGTQGGARSGAHGGGRAGGRGGGGGSGRR